MPNFSFSTANNFLRFTPESLDAIKKRIAEKKAKYSKALEKGDDEPQEENIRPQLDLKDFKKLPVLYGKPPPWLIGEPLEDVDPYYRDHETFMVLSSRSRIFRFTASKSLFLFSPFHPLRRLAIKILIHVYPSTFSQKFGSISALRIFRILRTLKAVSVIPGLKVIISSLLHSVKKLANVMLLTVFSLAVFALVGLQLFMGNLRYNCVPYNYGDYFSTSSKSLLCGFSSDANKTECPINNVCVKQKENPDFGYTSFDHLGWAFLSLFRLMTQDSWEHLYRQVIRTSGKSYSIFFCVIIFLCSFYLFNLILAVVSMAYEEQNKATLAQTKAREMLLQEAKKVLKKEKEIVSQRLLALSNENLEMPSKVSENKNEKRKNKRKKKCKSIKPRTYGEDETMFYSPPDKSQKELQELVMSYHLPVEILDDPFQRQKLTSAANVISKTMGE
ncbi:sodium channel protein type 5 subunit alpha-like [Candoia aspera]|uniref:sodium channel protein type 5 subunit alpha-like n=1 Tax=Candoia aspera TaxID=51853 RepID=UPI002FD80C27